MSIFLIMNAKIFGHSVLGSVPKIFAITAHDDLKSVESASNTHTKPWYPMVNDKKLGG